MKRLKKLASVLIAFFFLSLITQTFVHNIYADAKCDEIKKIGQLCPSPAKDTQLGCGGGFGPFADVFCGGDFSLGNIFNNAISKILGFLTIIAALYFFFQFVTAGIQWIGSGGDKANIEQARNKMINAIIGLVVVAAAWVIAGIIGMFVGINILNPGSLLDTLQLHPGTTQ